MAAASSYLAAAALVAAAGSAVKQKQIATENRRTERKNAALARAAEAYRNAQEARRGIAAARVRSAQAMAIGEAQGVSDSSSVSGAAGSVFSQVAGQIGGNQVSESAAYGISRNNAMNARRVGSLANQAALFSVASQGFAAAAGMGSAPQPMPQPVMRAPNQIPNMGAMNAPQPSFSAQGWINSFGFANTPRLGPYRG